MTNLATCFQRQKICGKNEKAQDQIKKFKLRAKRMATVSNFKWRIELKSIIISGKQKRRL